MAPRRDRRDREDRRRASDRRADHRRDHRRDRSDCRAVNVIVEIVKIIAGAVHNFATTDTKLSKLCRALFGRFLRRSARGDKLAGKGSTFARVLFPVNVDALDDHRAGRVVVSE